MPKIPTYDSPQVKSQSLPGVSIKTGGVNPGAFGAEQGEQLQKAGQILNVVGDNMEKAREQQAIADGMDAANDLQERAMKKQQELQQRAGKDAAGVQDEFTKWHDEQQAELQGKLKDPDAQSIFQRNAQKIKLRDMDWAGGYQKQQGDIYHEVTMKTGIENASNAALMNPTRDNVSASISEIRSYYGELAHRKGYDADWVTANTRQAEQKIHGDILQNAIDQDAVGSVSSYIKEFGDSLDPGLKGKAEKWVHNKVIDETAGAYADTLIASGVPFSEGLQGIRDKYAGEDEDKYVRRYKERYGEVEQIKREQIKEINDKFEKLAYTKGADKLTDEDLDALAERDAGAAAHWKNLRNESLDIKAAGGESPKHSKPVYLAEATKRLNSDGPDRIVNESQLAKYKQVLSESDYKALSNGLGDNKKISDTDLFNAYKLYVPEEQKNRNKWSESEWNNYFTFKKHAQAMVSETATPEAVRKLSAEWWKKGVKTDSGFDLPIIGRVGRTTITQGDAVVYGAPFEATEKVERNAITEPGFQAEERLKQQEMINSAAEWAKNNPNDPRAAEIKKRLGL